MNEPIVLTNDILVSTIFAVESINKKAYMKLIDSFKN